MHSDTRCLPLCEAWEFNPRPSYSELLRSDYSTPDGEGPENLSMSRVTVNIGSTYYMERTQVRLKPGYKTFIEITDVAGLYLGVSVITAAEIVFYGFELCLVYKRTRLKANQVSPLPLPR